MIMDELTIKGITPINPAMGTVAQGGPARAAGPGFGELLKGAIEAVNHMQHESGKLEDAVAKGESMNIHQAIIAGEKAGLSFRLMMQVRNKLLDAYREVMRIQV